MSCSRNFAAHESFGSVESVKAVSEIFTPVSGNVSGVNDSLNDEPEKVNKDPYGEGWMIKIAGGTTGDVMDSAAYEKDCAGRAH